MADSRFSALSSDPRYRLPSRKEARTAVDPRFKGLFTDQEFRKKASVDRYGRKIKPTAGKRDLERLYRLDDTDASKTSRSKAGNKVEREVVGSSDESDASDDSEHEELVGKRDPAREGFSESESSEEETSEEDDESDSEVDLADETAGQEQTEDIPVGDVSRRIACVNLDWDNIRAADIMAVSRSFVPATGRIQHVTIYPSEFGRERLEREETEGPPRDIFASSSHRTGPDQKDIENDSSDEDDDEKIKNQILQNQASEGEEFDSAKLRQYQLERLRYYYAVIECDSKSTAKALYDSMDGREYLSTSNFFDLRFIPDDTSFDDDRPHDECSNLPQGYKPNDFRTEALTHSKVRLTWDNDDATRKEVQRRAFSRAELDENDLQAYIGSDDSDADSTTSRRSAAEDRKAKKREAQRAKMREALGLSSEPSKQTKKDKDEVVGDMQITFTSGLGGSKEDQGVFENEPQDEESTRARYIRKEKERKQKRKERQKARQNEDDEKEEAEAASAQKENDEEDPFNDPFFTNPELASKQAKAAKKASKQAEKDRKAESTAEAKARKAELSLLMAGENDQDGVRHFDMREIEKAQKQARRKGKRGSKKRGGEDDDEQVRDDFKVETSDPRFKDLFESHEYAIDPTHPRFNQGSEAMKGVLEEGRRRRKRDVGDEDDEAKGGKKARREENGDGEDVKGLVARLKTKGGGKKGRS